MLRITSLTFLFLMFAVIAGCGGATNNDAKPTQGDAVDAAPTPVKLMLNWYPEAEHGGYYAALVHGFYREEGLDVTIIKGGPNAPVVPQTARGAVEFGITNADRILLATNGILIN